SKPRIVRFERSDKVRRWCHKTPAQQSSEAVTPAGQHARAMVKCKNDLIFLEFFCDVKVVKVMGVQLVVSQSFQFLYAVNYLLPLLVVKGDLRLQGDGSPFGCPPPLGVHDKLTVRKHTCCV